MGKQDVTAGGLLNSPVSRRGFLQLAGGVTAASLGAFALPGLAAAQATAMSPISDFPTWLVDLHHTWHQPGAHPGVPSRSIPQGQAGSGKEFLVFHHNFMALAFEWFATSGRLTQLDVSPWTAIPSALKTSSAGWNTTLASDETRVINNSPAFASVDALGIFLEGRLHGWLHTASSTIYNDGIVGSLHSPQSTRFYKIHGLVDYWWSGYLARNPALITKQSNWRWCSKCAGMWFAGNGAGLCPAGGNHSSAGSGNYALGHNTALRNGQDNWRWCSKCTGLFFWGNASKGRCPAGGTHANNNSGNYILAHQVTVSPGQSNWRWCNKCQGLFFAGNGLGVCPAGSSHSSTNSGNYCPWVA